MPPSAALVAAHISREYKFTKKMQGKQYSYKDLEYDIRFAQLLPGTAILHSLRSCNIPEVLH